jgi:hypothetical protein
MDTQEQEAGYPVAWRDPYNGDTERLAADVKAWNERMNAGVCEWCKTWTPTPENPCAYCNRGA